jgi:hypothetical protein
MDLVPLFLPQYFGSPANLVKAEVLAQNWRS